MNTLTNVKRIVSTLANQRVLVVGDLMLDLYLWGKATRLSPEAPVPVLEVSNETCFAGGAANVAMNVAAFGASVHLVGTIGDDLAGRMLMEQVRQAHIPSQELVILSDRPTTQKKRVMASTQQLVRIDYEDVSPIPEWAEEQILQTVEALLPQTDVMILSDYQKGVLTGCLAPYLIGLAKKRNIPVITDSKAPYLKLFEGSIVTPNRLEAERASGCRIKDEESLKQAGAILAEQTGNYPVVITLGEEGIALLEPHETPLVVPAISTSVYDVTGAGDTVVGMLAMALAAGFSLRESVVMANYAAAVVIRESGTAVCTVEKLQAMVRESGHYWNTHIGGAYRERITPYGT